MVREYSFEQRFSTLFWVAYLERVEDREVHGTLLLNKLRRYTEQTSKTRILELKYLGPPATTTTRPMLQPLWINRNFPSINTRYGTVSWKKSGQEFQRSKYDDHDWLRSSNQSSRISENQFNKDGLGTPEQIEWLREKAPVTLLWVGPSRSCGKMKKQTNWPGKEQPLHLLTLTLSMLGRHVLQIHCVNTYILFSIIA